jgi:hypothetical protein
MRRRSRYLTSKASPSTEPKIPRPYLLKLLTGANPKPTETNSHEPQILNPFEPFHLSLGLSSSLYPSVFATVVLRAARSDPLAFLYYITPITQNINPLRIFHYPLS